MSAKKFSNRSDFNANVTIAVLCGIFSLPITRNLWNMTHSKVHYQTFFKHANHHEYRLFGNSRFM